MTAPGRRINVLELRCVIGSGGGPEKTILLSAKMADRARFNVMLAYIRNAADPAYTMAQRAGELGLQLHDLPERRMLDPVMLVHLIRLIRSEKVDIVHAHDYKTNLIAVLLRPFLRYKLVSTAHGWVTKSLKLEIYYFLDKLALRYSNKVLCVSTDLRDELLRWGVSSDKVIYLRNGVDTDRFRRIPAESKLRTELRLRPDQPLVGGIGRLSPEKDFSTFLRVAHRVVREITDAVFVLIGEGPDRASLERLAGDLGLRGRVLFLGQRHDILDVYHALDLFLLTSAREGLPNVVLEAMAMELPVVATDVGGVRGVMTHGLNGLLCRSGDVDGLAQATVTLLRDRVRAQRLGAAARETVCRECSFAERVRKLEGLYLELMGRQGTNEVSPAVSSTAS